MRKWCVAQVPHRKGERAVRGREEGASKAEARCRREERLKGCVEGEGLEQQVQPSEEIDDPAEFAQVEAAAGLAPFMHDKRKNDGELHDVS